MGKSTSKLVNIVKDSVDEIVSDLENENQQLEKTNASLEKENEDCKSEISMLQGRIMELEEQNRLLSLSVKERQIELVKDSYRK